MVPQLFSCGYFRPQVGYLSGIFASMVPQLFSCGYGFHRWTVSGDPELLQWCRSFLAADTHRCRIPLGTAAGLQWCRSFLAADTLHHQWQNLVNHRLQWCRSFLAADTWLRKPPTVSFVPELQWCRSFLAADTSLHGAVAERVSIGQLQWCRSFLAADTLARRRRCGPFSGFNGAAAF